jgi:Na+/proline symporter
MFPVEILFHTSDKPISPSDVPKCIEYITVFTIIALIQPGTPYTILHTIHYKKKKKKKKKKGECLGASWVGIGNMVLEIATIIGCTALLGLWNFILTRSMATRLVMEVRSLDKSLVEIVEKLMDSGIAAGAGELNPVQMLLAQFIQKKIETMPQDVAVVTPMKDDSGKFVKKNE